jgi:hypothetical protein
MRQTSPIHRSAWLSQWTKFSMAKTAAVVADRAKDDVGRIPVTTFEMAAAEVSVSLHVPDYGSMALTRTSVVACKAWLLRFMVHESLTRDLSGASRIPNHFAMMGS